MSMMGGFHIYPRTHMDKLQRVKGCQPELVACLIAAAQRWAGPAAGYLRFTEGLRTPQRQAELYRKGLSWTLDSKHLTGDAVDVALFPGRALSWEIEHYRDLNHEVQEVALELGVRIEWGGNWKQRDAVHFQIDG